MERLVDKIVPDDTTAPGPASSQQQEARRSHSGSSPDGSNPRRRHSSVDIIEGSAASEGPIAALLAMRHESVHRRGPSESGHIPTPALTSAEPSTPTLPTTATTQGTESRPMTSVGGQAFPPIHKSFWVSSTFRNILPPTPVLDAIVAASPGAPYAAGLCYSEAERLDGKIEPISFLAVVPPVSAHPLRFAKRALQILICIQQLPPTFDWDSLNLGASMAETTWRLLNTSILVTTNDDLIGYAEGIECLILQACSQANGGNLRKAWTLARRALSLAQMMGIDKGLSAAFRSCDPNANPHYRTSADVLWSKVVQWDRYLSLLLGLPVGSQGDEFASGKACENDTPIDRLEKAHAVLSARIIRHNDNHQRDPTRHQISYALTQEIDLELEAAAKAMPPGWWDDPRFDAPASSEAVRDATARAVLQIQHFTLTILLHVPYMLRDPLSPRHDYSKTTCAAAARDLLRRLLALRGAHDTSAHSCCRHADYAGLLAAMTLCLSYLSRRRMEAAWEPVRLREDADMVERTRRRMEHIARAGGGWDRPGRAAVTIIEQLAPIIDAAAASWGEGAKPSSTTAAAQDPWLVTTMWRPTEVPAAPARDLHFSVPYLGAITIKMSGPNGGTSSTDRQGGYNHNHNHHRRHPSSATGALERMVISSPTPAPGSFSSSGARPPSSSSSLEPRPPDDGLGIVQFAPYDDHAPFGTAGADAVGGSGGVEPDFVAGGDEWGLQGVDGTYWLLFKGIS